MPVTVLVPEAFQTATGGADLVEVAGETIGRCLEEAVKKYPPSEALVQKPGEAGSLPHDIAQR
jgi:hypothetical protein